MRERRAAPGLSAARVGLLASLAAAAVVCTALLGDAGRARLAEALGPGIGARAARVAAGLGALALAAWGLLPGAYHADRILRSFRVWWGGRSAAGRLALAPAAGFAAVLEALAKVAFLIAAAGVAGLFLLCLLLVLWVFVPEFLGGFPALWDLVTM